MELKRPRVAENVGLGLLVGGGFGALAGLLLSPRKEEGAGAAIGAAIGAPLGMLATASSQAVSLERALRIALQKLEVEFISLRRHGRFKATLLFRMNTGFKAVEAAADPNHPWTPDDLEDQLYGDLVRATMNKLRGEK